MKLKYEAKRMLAIMMVATLFVAAFPISAMAAGSTIYFKYGATGTTGTIDNPVANFSTAKTLISDGDNIELMGTDTYALASNETWSLSDFPNSKVIIGNQFTNASAGISFGSNLTLTLSDITISTSNTFSTGTISMVRTTSTLVIGQNVKIEGVVNKFIAAPILVSAPLTSTLNIYPKDSAITSGSSINVKATGGYVLTASDVEKLNCTRSGYYFAYDSTTGTVTIVAGTKPTTITSANTTVSDIADQTYTGSDITPALTVKYGDTTLTEGTDYTVSYSNNKGVGTATATIAGEGSYTGSIDKTFNIVGKSISDSSVSVSAIADQTYTGSDIEPDVTVSDGSTALVKDTDYTVSYSNNKGVGTATATITGKGNYTGSTEKTFAITSKSIGSGYTVDAIADQAYTGSAIEPSVAVKSGDTTLTKDTDYTVAYSNNVNAGTATATVTGKGNYSGSITKDFTITAKSLTSASITVDAIAAQAYTGSALTPAVTVKDGSTALTGGTDYTVAYTKNVDAGTATVTISGAGNYSGDITKTFTITPVSISKASVTSVSDKAYTGKALKPSVTVKLNGATLKNGTDYTVSYSSNTNPGAAKITVKGTGNYTGSIVKTFNIIPKKQALSSVKNSASKKLKITWKKDSTVNGYQVRYATSKSFGSAKTVLVKKNSTTSATVSKLTKKKTYYVQVRAYKTISGKAYYGAWSSVKSQKVSK